MPKTELPKMNVGWTNEGRPLHRGWKGDYYSERSVTIPYNGQWVVFPSVGPDGTTYDQSLLEQLLFSNGPVDPMTGASLPLFKTVDEANNYAKKRSSNIEFLLFGAQ